MAIKSKTPFEAINHVLQQAADIVHERILYHLRYLGEECVTRIREKGREGDWMDQTGNLRSSIGTAVYDHGRQYMVSAFQSIGGPDGNGKEGSDKGKQYIDQLAREYAKVYALVVVAGMDYAAAVETKRDVLESTKLWAETQIEDRMKRAKAEAEKRINRMIRQL